MSWLGINLAISQDLHILLLMQDIRKNVLSVKSYQTIWLFERYRMKQSSHAYRKKLNKYKSRAIKENFVLFKWLPD